MHHGGWESEEGSLPILAIDMADVDGSQAREGPEDPLPRPVIGAHRGWYLGDSPRKLCETDFDQARS